MSGELATDPAVERGGMEIGFAMKPGRGLGTGVTGGLADVIESEWVGSSVSVMVGGIPVAALAVGRSESDLARSGVIGDAMFAFG